MSKRKAPEGRRERMAFYNTLSDRELAKLPDSELPYLSCAAVLRLPSERRAAYEQATASQLEEIRARNQEHQQALELVVAALCDGDVDYHRLEIELYRATGISVDRLLELWVGDFWAYARAEVNRRDPWVKVKAADCEPHRSTLGRHASDPSKPIQSDNDHGCWKIRKSALHEYVKPERLEVYEK